MRKDYRERRSIGPEEILKLGRKLLKE